MPKVDGTMSMKLSLLCLSIVTPLMLAGCGGGTSGTQSTGGNTEIENKISVSVDKSVLDPAEEYSLMSTMGTTKFVPTETSQVIASDNYNADAAKQMTIVSVMNHLDQSVLLAAITKDQKQVQINIDTTAEVMLLSTAKMMGVRVTNYPEFSRRVRLQPEFQEIKDALVKEIQEKSPCPAKSTCNTTAADAANRLMDKIDVTDIITAEGV